MGKNNAKYQEWSARAGGALNVALLADGPLIHISVARSGRYAGPVVSFSGIHSSYLQISGTESCTHEEDGRISL